MFNFKKHIAVIFAFVLLFPLAIQAAHAFEKHEHTVCKSVLDTHIHKKDLDCSELHQLLETNLVSFSSDFIPRISIFNLDIIISETVFVSDNYLIKKYSRGPPVIA